MRNKIWMKLFQKHPDDIKKGETMVANKEEINDSAPVSGMNELKELGTEEIKMGKIMR